MLCVGCIFYNCCKWKKGKIFLAGTKKVRGYVERKSWELKPCMPIRCLGEKPGIGIVAYVADIKIPASNISVRYLSGSSYFGTELVPASALPNCGTDLTGCRTVRHFGI